MTPFRMIGNLYFLGTREASTHLIDTGDGLILIDTGYEENADIIVENMETLGFDIRDVKIILHSHGHTDHTWGTPRLLELAPYAKTYLSFCDLKYINGFTPDYDINDGDVITLGNTSVYCMFTPGHTEGSVSFFFDVVEDGVTYRAAMFGGAGTNQLKRAYMNRREVPYLCRGLFFDSIERLLNEHVDVFVGNHIGHNRTPEKYERMKDAQKNPFIDPEEWAKFLLKSRGALKRAMINDSRDGFVTYAHRGASEYCPENTMMSFYVGEYMGANGIETDVQRTKDGVLVLFHDSTLERVTGESGAVGDYTYEQLLEFSVKNGERSDKIVTLDDFLTHFAHKNMTLAIELKCAGIEKDVADLIIAHGAQHECMVTSFKLEYIKNIKEYAPSLRIGYLCPSITDEVIEELVDIGADEVCPIGREVTSERVEAWHRRGFNVRAYGIGNEEIMKAVYDAGVDGMTVNFPDLLIKYIEEKRTEGEQ